MIVASMSRIGEYVTDAGNTVPSFRMRVVSRRLTGWPAPTLDMTASSSALRSSGTRSWMDSPTISSRE